MANRIHLAIVAIALATELGCVAFAVTPSVDAGYRAFYIDRTSGCLENGLPPGTYTFGDELHFGKGGEGQLDRVIVCGVGIPRTGGAWLIGDLAKLRFAVSQGGSKLTLEFEARGGETTGPRPLTIRANGDAVATFELRPKSSVYRIAIPADALGKSPGDLRITFEWPDDGLLPREGKGQRRSMFISRMRLLAGGA